MIEYRGFTVYGEPVGKGRPKFSTINGHAAAYTPKKTVNYENLVRLTYQEAFGHKNPFEKDVQLKVRIRAYFQIPKSASKKKRQQMLDREIRPTKKPDTDNVAKSICDALNGIAYYDDSQVVTLEVNKYYSDEPRALIEIMEVEEDED